MKTLAVLIKINHSLRLIGRAEGWVFAGEMRGSWLQLAYKVPVLGSQDLPGSQRAKTERGGAAARGRGERPEAASRKCLPSLPFPSRRGLERAGPSEMPRPPPRSARALP